MADHSDIVGGSTAKRVIACPGSVALVLQMPPKPSSSYADEGTLLHNTIADILLGNVTPEECIGATYAGVTLDQALFDAKLRPALDALNEVDPDEKMEFDVEVRVGFGDRLPGVFGSTDVVGRIGDRAIVLDWKFGSGVAVDVEENPQLMFYAAAAMRTPEAAWAFEGAKEVECIIVQPAHAPYHIKRWVTDVGRILNFERELFAAVKAALQPDAPLAAGDHCRWCAAKPICPVMTGAAKRALQTSLKNLDLDEVAQYLKDADLLEQWIADLRALAHQALDEGLAVPGFKLVQKRATRKWIDETKALDVLVDLGLPETELVETSVVSPAKVDKLLKKAKLDMPEGIVVSTSSGTTLAPEDDPRPAVLQIGKQLEAAFGKLR
jgi:hypothetical protein